MSRPAAAFILAVGLVAVLDGEGQQPAANQPPAPSGARVLDLNGRSVMPGWVGMHEHLF
jgi:imidazolonepropionase-like amidohydrolase